MPDNPIPVDPDADPPPHPRVRRRHRRWDVALVIAVGGALGSLARWALNEALPHQSGTFPWSTFLENVTGCLVLGALMVFLLDVWPPSRYARPFLAIGVLGGFTTFSTYTVDTRGLVAHGDGLLALTYLFGTLLVGLLATWAGLTVGRVVAGVAPRRLLPRRNS